VTSGGSADSMFQFLLKRGGDRTKRCRKIKRGQRARLGSMKMKCDMTRLLLGQKIKKMHVVNSTDINGW
jgi:hypothetical protein